MLERETAKTSGLRSDPPRAERRTSAGAGVSYLTFLQRAAGNEACVAWVVQRQSTAAPTRTTGAQQISTVIAERPGSAVEIASMLDEAQSRAPRDASTAVDVVIPPLAPITVASHELQDLLAEARAAAQSRAASSIRETAGLTRSDVLGARQRLAQIRVLAEDPDSFLAQEDRLHLLTLLASANRELARYEDLAGEGSTRTSALSAMGVFAGGLVADDATGVGVGDDVLLPFVGLAAIVTIIVSRPPPSHSELERAWSNVSRSLENLAAAGSGIVLAVQGERLAGNTRQLSVHLARLLALASVGGAPSGEPPKRNNDDDKHWWTEIKSFVRSIGQATKGASRKQVIRELLRQGYQEEQILEIERRLIEAAEKMGEQAPPFLPPP